MAKKWTRLSFLLLSAMALTTLSCSGSSKDGKQPSIDLTVDEVQDTTSTDQGEDLGAFEFRSDEFNFDGFDIDVGEALAKCLEEPFEFGCPCSTNNQCAGGFCVEGAFGYICTMECVEECPDPAYECKGMTGLGPDVVFLCLPKSIPMCKSCTIDSQCGDGICAKVGESNRCTIECGEGENCPAGYTCDASGTAPVCVPLSGDCNCLADNEGDLRACEVSNEYGLCQGVEVCAPESGWTECSAAEPALETCDGLDNDCDGSIDNDLGEPPVCGEGACTNVGVCLGAVGWQCTAPVATDEICDFKDNNCDGVVDEDFKDGDKYVSLNHCGTCNNDCVGTIPNATAACDGSQSTPHCVVGECDEGYFQWNDYQCLPAGQTLCKPCTSDLECGGGKCLDVLDGSYCSESCEVEPCEEGFECKDLAGIDGLWCLPVTQQCDCFAALAGAQQPCAVESEAGLCAGMQTCHPVLGWSQCNAPDPTEEFCDGLDNDCNGIPDDGLGGAEACEKTILGIGTCVGSQYCAGAQGWICDAPTPKQETCDYVDNDCDGAIDEDFVVAGKYASLHHCGGCNKDCDGKFPNATSFCDSAPAVPECKIEKCAEGYYMLNDYQCVPTQAVLCKPCSDDGDCYFAKCVQLEEGTFCLNPCDDGACDEGHSCQAMDDAGDICVPDSGSCFCSANTAGAKKGCSVSNEFGLCFGFEVCDPDEGWLECDAATPSAEVCDGADNDCDGQVDEGMPLSQPCEETNEWGTCTAQEYCQGQAGWVCQAAVPAEDVCNYEDDDCDGVADEDFTVNGKYTQMANCGSCGNDCTGSIANAIAKCDATYLTPKCVVDQCNEGYYKASATECLPKPDTTCDPCKNDAACLGGFCLEFDGQLRCAIPCESDAGCSGENVCLEYGEKGLVCQPKTLSCECNSQSDGSKRPCSAENEMGICAGFETCDAELGWSECSASPPSLEVCNGVDDDCNGETDETFPPFAVECTIENEFGTCTGWEDCQGALGLQCLADTPAAETCNYYDDNCDGTVDEDFVVDGKYAMLQACGNCNTDCTGTIENGTAACDASYVIPKCVVDVCDEGYYKANPFECLPVPDTTCQPCTTDLDCLGGTCLTLDGKSRCAVSCANDQECFGENICGEYEELGLFCQPLTGSCECNSGTAGSKQACSQSNELGECTGFRVCDAQAGWSDCSAKPPTEEMCNGIDDDCNGAIDDGLPESQDCENSNEFGTCTGLAYCAGALGWLCQAPAAKVETCDYEDNNCDGIADEPFVEDGKYVLFDHCGACNTSCKSGFPNATAKCDVNAETPECVVDQCDPGYFKINKYQCVDSVGSICAPCAVDGDCAMQGAVCTVLSDGKYCMAQCVESGDCSAGFVCQEVEGKKACIPENNSCTCTPVTVETVLPKETCHGYVTLTITGEGFANSTKVYLGEIQADLVTVAQDGTMTAEFADMPEGEYTLTVTNGGICTTTKPKEVTLIPEPDLYFVDPPVAYNGISIQVTAFVTNIKGGGVTFFGIRPSGSEDPFQPLDFTFAPDSPRRVKAIIPAGLEPGSYDVYLEDAPNCGALLLGGMSVTDTVSVNITSVDPSFGWTQERTSVAIYAMPDAQQGMTGFKSLPRAYLNPSNPGPDELAAGLDSIGFVDETRISAAVPAGLKVGAYDVVVINPDGGVGLLPGGFTVTQMAPPVIYSVSPGSVPNNVSPTVTITGKNFFGPYVSLICKEPGEPEETLNAAVSSWNGTSIVTAIPTKSQAAGTVCLVRVTNADGSYWTYSGVGITTPSENLEPMSLENPLNFARRAPSVVVASATQSAQFVYAIGGDDGSNAGALESIEAASLDAYGTMGTWTELSPALPQPRTLSAATAMGRSIYLAGGDNGSGAMASVLRATVLSPEETPVLDDLTLEIGEEGLIEGVWFYRVSAVLSAQHADNPGGESLPSDPLPVLVPTGLPDQLSPTIYWQGVAGAVGYRVYRSPTPGLAAGEEELVAAVDGSTHSWTDLGATTQPDQKPRTIGQLGVWHPLPPLNTARSGHGLAYALDPADDSVAYLYAVAGAGSDGAPLGTYEVLSLNAETGRPLPGAVWILVEDNVLAAPRSQIALFKVDGSVTSHVPAGEVWLMVGSGAGTGVEMISDVDGAKVLEGGLLSTWTASESLSPAFVGCGYAAAANQLWAFGGQNAKPTTGGKSAQLCGVGTSCGALPALQSWNAGISLKVARYLMGSAVGAAHIIVVGGVGADNLPLASVESTVW